MFNRKSDWHRVLKVGLVLLWIGGLGLLGGCESLTKITAAPAQKSGVQVWSENCATCHYMRPPNAYSDAQWDVAVHHMRVRANLTTEEQQAILEYLKAAN
jgi:hypothetical protein